MPEAPSEDIRRLAARRRMVEQQLRARGIQDPNVLDVMYRLPREHFLPPSLQDAAYHDQALPIGQGQTISQPYIVAYMTEQLAVDRGCTVLEVGTGTGYQTAILSRLAKHVYSIERLESLKQEAGRRLKDLHAANVTLFVGDGSLGLPQHAPFDRVIVTAGAPSIPSALTDQLSDGGVLVIPVGGPHEQTIVRVQRDKDRIVETSMLACRFVKLLGQAGWPTPEEGD